MNKALKNQVYILTSDGYLESCFMRKVASSEEALKLLLIEVELEMFGRVVVPESITIHKSNIILYEYTQAYCPDDEPEPASYRFITSEVV